MPSDDDDELISPSDVNDSDYDGAVKRNLVLCGKRKRRHRERAKPAPERHKQQDASPTRDRRPFLLGGLSAQHRPARAGILTATKTATLTRKTAT